MQNLLVHMHNTNEWKEVKIKYMLQNIPYFNILTELTDVEKNIMSLYKCQIRILLNNINNYEKRIINVNGEQTLLVYDGHLNNLPNPIQYLRNKKLQFLNQNIF